MNIKMDFTVVTLWDKDERLFVVEGCVSEWFPPRIRFYSRDSKGKSVPEGIWLTLGEASQVVSAVNSFVEQNIATEESAGQLKRR